MPRFGGLRTSPVRLQGWTPVLEQLPLFNQEVGGGFPGRPPVPTLEVHLIKREPRLGSEWGDGRGHSSGLGCLLEGLPALGPEDAQLAQGLMGG